MRSDDDPTLEERVASLHVALAWAQADYLSLFDVLSAERGAYDATIEELTGDPYARWLRKRTPRSDKRALMDRLALVLPHKPSFSFVVDARRATRAMLVETLDSLSAQHYARWEALVVYDGTNRSTPAAVMEAAVARDRRIKAVRFDGAGNALARAFSLAASEFVARIDPGDRLTTDALFEVALLLNAHPDADVVYTDEDEIDAAGTRDRPYFKPDWSPDSLLSRPYVGRLALYRRSVFEAAGGVRGSVEGNEDWDVALRVSERTEHIRHLPDVLYSRRSGERDDVNAASSKRILADAIGRRGERGTVTSDASAPGAFVIRYALPPVPPRASIIVPTRDHGADVERCLASIFSKSTYPDFEVILVDNGSEDPASLETFAAWAAREPRVRILRIDEPFNFSRLNNAAAANATGALLVFLNNDTEVRTPDWLEAMAEQALRPSIGAVGATLLYPSDEIQHAGVIVGLGPVAGHGHKNATYGTGGYHAMLYAVNNYSAVTAACLMVRRTSFEEAGGFDEELAVAYNDVDLCLKLRDSGLRNVCLPHVVLTHFESKSRGADVDEASAKRIDAETKLMQRRWNIPHADDPYYNPNLSLEREDYSVDA